MAYSARIIADSIAPSGKRLTTLELTYPRFVHSELLTHKRLSRNSSSSRAIPIQKMMERVKTDPVLPVWWGKNQPGMQANEEVSPEVRWECESLWLEARDVMLQLSNALYEKGLHKQIVNRLLEPWMWITVLVTATEFDNFFFLRTDKQAQPEIKRIADMACEVYYYGKDKASYLDVGQWHLPLILPEELPPDLLFPTHQKYDLRQISVARCARVSYLTHDGRRLLDEDLSLYTKLRNSGHWSPFEHVACALDEQTPSGNFIGWMQYRKRFANENCSTFDYDAWLAEYGKQAV